jgi:hypothetical protein
MKSRLLVTALLSAIILGVTPNSFAADTQPPVLISWKLLDTKADISSGDATLRAEFSVSDESTFIGTRSHLISRSTTQMSDVNYPVLISKVGNVSTWLAEVKIKFGKAPGVWTWVLWPLEDNFGNLTPQGPGGNWPVNVWIYDKEFTEVKQIAEVKAAADAKAIADKAAADAKAIADKAAADAKAIANRKEQGIWASPLISGSVPISSNGIPTQVRSTSNLPVFAYNSTNDVCVYENGIIKTKTSGRCVISFSQEGNSEFKPASNLILDFTIAAAATKKTTITCVKGKLTKKVTAVKPKCPTGYKVKK